MKKTLTILILSLTLTLTPFVFKTAQAQAEPVAEPEAEAPKQPSNKKKKELSVQEKLNILLPSQENLFDSSHKADLNQDGLIDDKEKLRLADGSLEQDLAPKLLQILIRLSLIGLTIFFIIAGLRLIAVRGNEEALTKTKELIVQAVIGISLITGSFAIIYGIIRLFNSL